MPCLPLSIELILAWADAHHARTGKWPTALSGPVYEALDESWYNIDQSLIAGKRGLTRGQTLARLLAERRGKRNQGRLPDLTVAQILAWADEYKQRTSVWPNYRSGAIPGTQETWMTVHMALCRGRRGLSKSTLAAVLAKERDVPKRSTKAPNLAQILQWADAHHEQTGKWPTIGSGPVAGSGGLAWESINRSLRAAGLFSVRIAQP